MPLASIDYPEYSNLFRFVGGLDVQEKNRKISVVLAKVGLDGHERGVMVIARGLMEAGMEVIYTGMYQTAEQVVAAAVQEDVDVLGISCSSGGHMAIFSRVLELMREEEIEDILLIGGGSIPQEDVTTLKEMGVSEIFRSGTTIAQVANYIYDKVGV